MATVDISVSRMRTDDRWMDRAACRGLTYLFFPLTAERPQARQRREALARSICASCSVRPIVGSLLGRTTNTGCGVVRARTNGTRLVSASLRRLESAPTSGDIVAQYRLLIRVDPKVSPSSNQGASPPLTLPSGIMVQDHDVFA